ncbi:MAG TPA: TonB-dependent receptor plug domain-containing protein [Candidatus Acidoferrales bacterium]|nr:TonB-dependent receptor plug domain-containing protein [Candidatus Acidoferrales bacterium]
MPRKTECSVSIGCHARGAIRAGVLLAILVSQPLLASPQQKSDDLTNHSIEDLMNIEVTSVSKTEQKLSRTASAIFVITQDDIAHSNATSIPDLLRMVPGVDVAQINSNVTALSIRGFNVRFADKLLVLVDGRSVYTPAFGGVFWDTLDLPLEDIDRIEVIRGPGGSIWGANAVNGVINIITKKASETHGGLVVAGGGNVNQGFETAQYGGEVAKSTDYRVYTKYFNNAHFPDSSGQDGGDGWHMLQGGFRTDTALSPKDTLMFQGNMYSVREGVPTQDFPSITSPGLVNAELLVNVTGGFLQGVWNHVYSPRSDTSLQVAYDQYERRDQLRENRGTLYLEFKDHIAWGTRQNIVWGLTYRDSNSRTDGNLFISVTPADLNTQLFGALVQDEIAIIPDRVYLTAGAILEHNYYTGINVMPSARAVWTPSSNQALWAAISDAVRTPNAIDTGILEAQDAPSLAVLDWMMPGLEGPQVCQRVREHLDRPYVYLLLLTARSQKDDLLRGLEAGADDYLTKPFDAQELRARLKVGQRILDLQRGLIAARDELRFRATHDALTGIANRGVVLDAIHREHARQLREGGSLGLIMVDLDHFKHVNDVHGHLAGDAVLKEVARRMASCARPYDTVGDATAEKSSWLS